MTKEQALEQLTSPSNHVRLKASRYLARWAEAGDLPKLNAARFLENDFYVRGSLNRAIDRLTQATTTQSLDAQEDVDVSDQSRRQIYAQATEWIAGLLLHEIAAPLGLIAFESSREIPNYGNSKTKVHIRTLQMVFDAIEQLRKASATPKPIEFNLAELISDIVITEFEEFSDRVALYGQKPLLLTSDPALLRFGICNGLKNAVEAVLSVTGAEIWPIVITWGETDVDYWIAIIDRGPGMNKPVETLLGIGKTTKEGHSGFGLPIAVAAINALSGTITLEAASGSGAKFELRWEK